MPAMQYSGADVLGSVRQMYNASGQVIANSRYDPYGNIISQGGAASSAYGFAGEQIDTTGLEYLRARYYSISQGRFVTQDPSDMDANAYLYTGANPVNRSDPTGLMSGFEAFAECFNIHTISQLGGLTIFRCKERRLKMPLTFADWLTARMPGHQAYPQNSFTAYLGFTLMNLPRLIVFSSKRKIY